MADEAGAREDAGAVRFVGRVRVVRDVLLPGMLLTVIAVVLGLLLGAAGRLEAQTVASTAVATAAPMNAPMNASAAGSASASSAASASAAPGMAAPGMPVPVGGGKAKKSIFSGGNVATSSLGAYLARVRAETSSVQPAMGTIWTDTGRLTRLTTDVRAMRPNDLIQVVVSESLAATTTGTVKNTRASSANSGISGLLGTLKAGNALQNLITQNSSNALTAAGDSETGSSLTTTFGGQVVDVLPNGLLVIEAARQVEFAQQTQTIVLRGLVRPEDISQQNQVLSTAISSLELEVKGKGIVNDYTRRQNPLVRWLQQILVF
jgi:flagellar L-ring protein precursor FlgH